MIATASIGHIILSVDASPAIRVVDPGVPLADHWTAQQVAQFPDRLVAFCSFNPLADYALDELDRCKASGRFTGVKLHFGTSEVDLRNPDHVKKVRAVVQAANRSRMPIVVHVRADANYGRIEAEIMLNDVIAAAPDVPLQIAHLCGGEQFRCGAPGLCRCGCQRRSAYHEPVFRPGRSRPCRGKLARNAAVDRH